jgi:hypothetical protein
VSEDDSIRPCLVCCFVCGDRVLTEAFDTLLLPAVHEYYTWSRNIRPGSVLVCVSVCMFGVPPEV